MSMIELPDASLCVRLAATMGHFLWQGAAVYLLVILAGLLLRRSTAGARYAVFLAALVIMAACPLATFVLLRSPDAPAVIVGGQSPPDVRSEVETPSAFLGGQSPPYLGRQGPPYELGAVPPPAEPVSLAVPAEPAVEAIDWWRYAPWLVACYLGGTTLMFARLLVALCGGQRLRRRSEPVDDSAILAAFARQTRALGLRFTPAIAFCREVAVPTVVGVLRPMILLPLSAVSGLTTEQIEVLLAHELAHIRRYDHIVNILQRLIEAALFFHPAVWFVSRRIRIEREHCCDDLVLAVGGQRFAYAESLVRMAELSKGSQRSPYGAAAALGADGHGSQLRGRILRIIGGGHEQIRLTRIRGLAVCLISLMAIAACVELSRVNETARSEAASDQEETPTATQPVAEKAATQPMAGTAIRPAAEGLSENDISLLAMGRRAGTAVEWWSPGGEPTKVRAEVASRASMDGVYAVFRMASQELTVTPHCMRGSSGLEFKSFERVGGTDQWIGLIDFPDERRYMNMLIEVSAPPWQTLYELPLTEADAGQSRRIDNYAIERVEDLTKLDERSFHVRILHGRLEGVRFAAVDKQGQVHPARETPDPSVQVTELTFDLPLGQLRGLARQDPTRYWVNVRNISLRPGVRTKPTTTFNDLEKQRRNWSDELKRRAAEVSGKPFVYNLPNGAVVQLVGLARLSGRGVEYWAPDGSRAENPGIGEADIEEGGTFIAYRVLGEVTSWQSRTVTEDPSKKQHRGSRLPSAQVWIEPIDSPPGIQFDDFAITSVHGDQYKDRARFEISAEDIEEEKQIKRDGVARILNLRRLSPKSFEVEIVYSDENPARGDYFAIDKAGELHKSTTRAAWPNKQQCSFDCPIEELTAMICREPVLAWARFRGISLQPGQKTNVQAEIGAGQPDFAKVQTASPRTKPRPQWVTLPSVNRSPQECVLDLASNAKLPLPDEEGDQAWDKHFIELKKGDIAYDGQLLCFRGATAGEWKLGKIEPWEPAAVSGDLKRYDLPKQSKSFLVTLANGDICEINQSRVSGQSGIQLQHRKSDWFKQGQPIQGVVLGPDDKPVGGARVAFASSSPTTDITNNEIDRLNRGPVIETDERGRYSFPPHPFAYTLVAMHDKGFALKSGKELAEDSTLKLAAWARVEGTVRVGSKPAPYKDVEIEFDTFQSEKGIYLLMRCRAKTDEQGRYVMERVPPMPAPIYVSEVLRESQDGMIHTGRQHHQWIEPPAGKTLTVNLGGTGRAIVGRFASPAGRRTPIDWNVNMNSFALKQPEPPYPSGIRGGERQEWLEAWRKTPEGHAHMLTGRRYSIRVEEDGSFRLDDIAPGTYALRFDVFEPTAGRGREYEHRIGGVDREIIAPETPDVPGGEPLDVGTLELGGSSAPVTAKPRGSQKPSSVPAAGTATQPALRAPVSADQAVKIATGQPEAPRGGSRAWYVLRQSNCGPLLRELPLQLAKMNDPSVQSSAVWKGHDGGVPLEIDVRLEDGATGEILVGLFTDAKWSQVPIRVEKMSGAGRHTITGVPPGKYQIGAMMGTLLKPTALGVHKSWPQPVEVAAGRSNVVEVLVSPQFEHSLGQSYRQIAEACQPGRTVASPDSPVQGRVTDSNGRPVAHVIVQIRQHGLSPGPMPMLMMLDTATDDQGRYFLDKKVGRFTIGVLCQESLPAILGSRSQWVRASGIRQGKAEINFDLKPFPRGSATLSGRCADQDGKPVQGFLVILEQDAEIDEEEQSQRTYSYRVPCWASDGRFALTDLPPGKHRMRWIPLDHEAYEFDPAGSVDVEMKDGQASEVAILIRQKGVLYGRVLMEDGKVPPAAVKPPWPGALMISSSDNDGAMISLVGQVDSDGHVMVRLAKKDREALDSGEAVLSINYPNPGVEKERVNWKRVGVFPLTQLSPDRTKAGVVKIRYADLPEPKPAESRLAGVSGGERRNDLETYLRLGMQLSYPRVRRDLGPKDLSRLHAMLPDPSEVARWGKIARLIGYLSDDRASVPLIIAYVRRSEDVADALREKDDCRQAIMSKLVVCESLGFVGGPDADRFLRHAFSVQGAEELVNGWEAGGDVLKSFKDGRQDLIELVRGWVAVGLVATKSPENIRLVEDLYRTEHAKCEKSRASTQLHSGLVSALAIRDAITELGFYPGQWDESEHDIRLSPYFEKYRISRRSEPQWPVPQEPVAEHKAGAVKDDSFVGREVSCQGVIRDSEIEMWKRGEGGDFILEDSSGRILVYCASGVDPGSQPGVPDVRCAGFRQPTELRDGETVLVEGKLRKNSGDRANARPEMREAFYYVIVAREITLLPATTRPVSGTGQPLNTSTDARYQKASLMIRFDIPGAGEEAEFGLDGQGARRTVKIRNGGESILDDLPPGTYDFFRLKMAWGGGERRGIPCDRRTLTLAPGATSVVEVIRKEGHPLEGELVDQHESKIAGAFILVRPAAAEGLSERETIEFPILDHVASDGDGEWKTAIIPPGDYLVTAEAYKPDPGPVYMSVGSRPSLDPASAPDPATVLPTLAARRPLGPPASAPDPATVLPTGRRTGPQMHGSDLVLVQMTGPMPLAYVGTARVTVPKQGKPPRVRIEMKPADGASATPSSPPSESLPGTLEKMLDATVVIDAGHGGKDPGASGVSDVPEKTIVLDIARRLERALAGRVSRVIMTRSDDRFIELDARAAVADREKADLFISIHADASSRPERAGVDIGLATKASYESQRIALSIKAAMAQGQIPCNGISISSPGFRVLTGHSRPGVMVRVGRLTNTDDAARLKDAAYQQKMAEAIAAGVIDAMADRQTATRLAVSTASDSRAGGDLDLEELEELLKRGPLSYEEARRMIRPDQAHGLYPMLERLTFWAEGRNLSRVIGYVTKDEQAVRELLVYAKKTGGQYAFESIGLIGGSLADNILRLAFNGKATEEMSRGWSEAESELLSGWTIPDYLAKGVKSAAATGLVLTRKPENIALVKAAYEENRVYPKDWKKKGLYARDMNLMTEAMAVNAVIEEKGMEYYLSNLGSDTHHLSMLSPYFDKYMSWPPEEQEASAPASDSRSATRPAPSDVADVPVLDLNAGGNEKMRYFLIGPRPDERVSAAGYKLVVVLPGGNGGVDFHPFVCRLFKFGIPASYIVAQPVAFAWAPDQQTVWPTRMSKVPGQQFATEDFVEAVIKDVRSKHKLDDRHIYTLSWSSGGPAAYAVSLAENSPVTGSFVAMSVFKPDQLPSLDRAKGRAYYLYHSPNDRVCPYRMAEEAESMLNEKAAAVTLKTYQGGHGWQGGAVYGAVRDGIKWIERQHGDQAPSAGGGRTTLFSQPSP